MMKKLITLFIALLMCSSLTLPCFAETVSYIDSEGTYQSAKVELLDASESIPDEAEEEIIEAASGFASRSGFSIAILTTRDIGEDKSKEGAVRFSEEMYNELLGEDSNGILLFINNDTQYDNICVHGDCEEYYNNARLADVFNALYEEWGEKDLQSACLLFIDIMEYYYNIGAAEKENITEDGVVTGMDPEDIPSGPIGEDIIGKPKVKILDEYNYLTPSEENDILAAAREFSDKSDMNIVFVITDEIGSDKSDRAVMNYADDRYDELCGINTDGVLLLINNDTKYDWISTSGSGINYYSDERIDRIFDRIYDDIVAGDYYSACIGFVDKCEYYFEQGKANEQVGIEFGDGYLEIEPRVYIVPFFVMLVAVGITSSIAYSCIVSSYKLKKSETTRYTVPGSLVLSTNITESKGLVTVRTYSPRNSGSSGRSGGGRSSTHRSSSGGRHGGGGRRR